MNANMVEDAKKQINVLINSAYMKACSSGMLPEIEPPVGAMAKLPDRTAPFQSANSALPGAATPRPGGIAKMHGIAAQLHGSVEIPRDASHGDYAATHAMAAAKLIKTAPVKIAEELINHIILEGSYFKACSVAGPGFINFTLSDNWYGEVLRAVETMGGGYGAINEGEGKRVMVEFVSANPTGIMTIGNARGGVLGDTLASVLEKAGYEVWREFLVNDAGNQIDLLGKSIEARYMQLCDGPDNYEFPEEGYHGDDIKNLAELLYKSDCGRLRAHPVEERAQKCISFALPHLVGLMRAHLERYRIHFDRWFYESSLHENGYITETLDLLDRAGLIYEKDGAVWLRNTQLGADKDEVMRKSNGFYTYYAVDIAYHRDKLARGFDKAIDIWGADHHGHVIRLKTTLKSPELGQALGMDGEKLELVIMQMVRLMRDGEIVKVSKRTGKALTLNDLLDEISVDACRFFFNAKPDSHLDFDLGLAVRQDSENPVYYVQYAHARICSLIATLAAEGIGVPDHSKVAPGLLGTEAEQELIKQIALLPEEVKAAARDYDPSRINKYVVELAARFHRFYASCRIKGEEEPLLLARLKLAGSTRVVIGVCLGILGVTAPEKM